MRIIVDEQLAHMASDAPYAPQHLSYPAVAVQLPQGLDTADSSPRHYPYELVQPSNPFQQPPSSQMQSRNPHHDIQLAASASDLYMPSTPPPNPESASPGSGGPGANHYPASSSVPRLPPILQVEKQQVTTSATQLASASRRRNEAHFVCPVPGCGSTFTRRFNLRGHLRSHTEERPYVCEWPGCKKGFARQHDCKRHQALHAAKSQANVCGGCKKTFSRLDALNRHLRSEGGAECRQHNPKFVASLAASQPQAIHLAQSQVPPPPDPSQLPPLTPHQQQDALHLVL